MFKIYTSEELKDEALATIKPNKKDKAEPRIGFFTSVIASIDICMAKNFGTVPTLTLELNSELGLIKIPTKNQVENLGFVLQILTDVIDTSKDTEVYFSRLNNVGCRLFVVNDRLIAIGNIVYNKFVKFDDLLDYKPMGNNANVAPQEPVVENGKENVN